MRSERGVYFGKGGEIQCKPESAVQKKCGPNGRCALDKGVPWIRGGGVAMWKYRHQFVNGHNRLSKKGGDISSRTNKACVGASIQMRGILFHNKSTI